MRAFLAHGLRTLQHAARAPALRRASPRIAREFAGVAGLLAGGLAPVPAAVRAGLMLAAAGAAWRCLRRWDASLREVHAAQKKARPRV